VDVPIVTVSESTRRDLLDLEFKKVFVVQEGLNFTPLSGVPEKEEYARAYQTFARVFQGYQFANCLNS